jgi:hypothetical protein
VGRGDDVVHREQRMSGVAHRLVLEHVEGRHARTAGTQCRDQRPWFDEFGAACVDK